MTRRQPSTLEAIAPTHWGVGLVFGFLVLFLGFVVLPALLSFNPILAGIGAAMQSGPLSMLVWFLAGMCWLASLLAFIGRAQRARLLDAQSGLSSLRLMSWQQFERLVAEAYRRQGYRVEECGQGGADGGVDLILRREGQTVLVQCKQWRSQKVGAPVVREQFGLLAHHGADRVVIATVGEFTAEARAFAQGKPIDLLHGAALVESLGRFLHAARLPGFEQAHRHGGEVGGVAGDQSEAMHQGGGGDQGIAGGALIGQVQLDTSSCHGIVQMQHADQVQSLVRVGLFCPQGAGFPAAPGARCTAM